MTWSLKVFFPFFNKDFSLTQKSRSGSNSVSSKIHVYLELQNMTLFRNEVFTVAIKLRINMRSHWIRVGPKSSEKLLLIEKDTERSAMWSHRQRLELCCHKPRYAGSPAAGRSKAGFSPRDFGGAWPCCHLEFGLLAFTTARTNFWCFKPPISGNLFWKF